MATLIGGSPLLTDTALGARTFSPGDRMEDQAGKLYLYVKASSAIALYDVCTIDPATFITTVAPLGTANDGRGNYTGVAAVAIASGSYGWLQVYGACTMNVLASCAANVRLNTTGTAGSLDDDGTGSSMAVDGIYLTTARGSTAGSAPGVLNNPAVGVTL